MNELSTKRCEACESGVPPLSAEKRQDLLSKITDWQLSQDDTTITRTFTFKGFGKTMAFVNAVAWIAAQENHHPDISFGFNYCTVNYTTHAIHGLSVNDFICAAKVEALFI